MDIKTNYLNQVVDEINMMIAVISPDNTLLSANKALLDFAKVELKDIVGMAYWDLPWWQHSPDLQNKLLFAINDSYMGNTSRFNATHTDSYGNLYEIDFLVKPVMKDDEPEYIITMGYNITELVQAQEVLTQRDRRLKAFFDYSIEGYFFLSLPDQIQKELVNDEIVLEIIDQYRLEGMNPRLLEIIGKETVDVTSIFEALGITENLDGIIQEVIDEGFMTLETKIMVDEVPRYLNVIFAAIYNELQEFEGNFAIVRDVTSEFTYLENIKYLANKDYLTGINNRRSFFNQGEELFKVYKDQNKQISVVMLDIDYFKNVNDTYGHDAGDVVIREVAEYIDAHISEDCILGRYGGEEYVMILPNDVESVFKMFENIRLGIKHKIFKYEALEIRITISIGLVAVDFKTDNLEGAITKADKALYEAKENGRNQSTIFIESIHGVAALDPITGLFNETSLKFKLSKALHDIKRTDESMWVVYFELEILKEENLLSVNRQHKTMSLCLNRGIRERDFIGRVGEHGFLITIKHVNARMVGEIYERITDLIELGFSGMIETVVNISGDIYDASMSTDVNMILDTVKNNTKKVLL